MCVCVKEFHFDWRGKIFFKKKFLIKLKYVHTALHITNLIIIVCHVLWEAYFILSKKYKFLLNHMKMLVSHVLITILNNKELQCLLVIDPIVFRD